MNELQRAEYLSVLGVASYVPRFVLPLAPEPRQAQLPPAEDALPQLRQAVAAPASPLLQSVAQIVSAPTQQGRGASASAPDITVLTRPDESVSSAQPVLVTQVAPPRQEVQPFVLNCWRIGEELLAVDNHEPGAALPLDALFGNIIRAMNWHQLPRHGERLYWPMAENRFGPAADASEARDTFSSWLEASCARHPVKSIWLMGSEAQKFCTPLPLSDTVNNWQGVRVLAMPSLSQLLQKPDRKRKLWQLLRETYPVETRAQ
ncbi:hypothetical protein [Microbulbifer sp. GL-2]|uniref:hypothetical protein n=1 Tax=Microbulbifer sp. GL-2 TaxID=2591606 RepID=UPI0011657654|nr:hypothetical protein [Microbulbifer sp. GL-2]BBM00660.1 hypothetical protein GL2_07340 [Microbulbifer sp. GL-2]